jgi:hypothetical protein
MFRTTKFVNRSDAAAAAVLEVWVESYVCPGRLPLMTVLAQNGELVRTTNRTLLVWSTAMFTVSVSTNGTIGPKLMRS